MLQFTYQLIAISTKADAALPATRRQALTSCSDRYYLLSLESLEDTSINPIPDWSSYDHIPQGMSTGVLTPSRHTAAMQIGE